jgi:hypothetical protein
MAVKTPTPVTVPTQVKALEEAPDPTTSKGLITILWRGGGEVWGYAAFGFLLGTAFCAWFNATLQKLVSAVPQTWQLAFVGACGALLATLRFVSSTVKKYRDARTLALSSEVAFRAARAEVELERRTGVEQVVTALVPVKKWLLEKKEDESLSTTDNRVVVDNARFKLLTPNTLRVSLRIYNQTRKPLVIQGLRLGWKTQYDSPLVQLTVLSTEFVGIVTFQDFSETFELVKVLETNALPANTWVSFGFTHNRIAWQYWSQSIMFGYDHDT